MSTPLPVPPPIMNSERLARVFSHKGTPKDNTRLALLGAVVLQLIAIMTAFAEMPDGTNEQLNNRKNALVNQGAIAALAVAYGFHERLVCAGNTATVQMTRSAQATLFEAYVAAVFIERDLDVVIQWLEPVFALQGQA